MRLNEPLEQDDDLAPQKRSFKDKTKLIWARSTPGQRLGGLVIMILFVGFVSYIGSILASAVSPAEQEETAGESVVKDFALHNHKQNKAIITDSKTQHGQNVQAAERARVKNDAYQGKSSIQAFTQDQSSDENSPYKVQQLREEKPEAKKQPVVFTADEINSQNRTKKTVQAKVQNKKPENYGLSEAQVEALTTDTINKTNRKEPGTADVYDRSEVYRDPFAGMENGDAYMQELNRRTQQTKKILESQIKIYTEARKGVSGGIKPIASASQGINGQNASGGVTAALSQARNESASVNNSDKPVPPMLLEPGEYIVVRNMLPVDSRIPGPMLVEGVQGLFKGAKIRCSVKDAGKFLVPTCSEMTLNKRKHPIEAIAINPETAGRVVEQDVDDDILFKTIAKVGADLLNTWGPTKLQQGVVEIEDNDTNEVRTEQNLSDRDIFIGSAASSLGELKGAADAYYAEASVKTIPANTIILLYMTSPIPDAWGVLKETSNGRY